MSDIAIIGLGEMGAALARAQLGAGYAVTVWNRTAAKAAPLVDLGAKAAPDPASAVRSAPVIMVCVDGYSVSDAVLADVDLRDRTLIQVSTGTPAQAKRAAAHVAAAGGAYLDGALFFYPNDIGAPGTAIAVGGPAHAFDAVCPHLQILCQDLQYLGDNFAGAAAMDMSVLVISLALKLGTAHAARIFEAEGLDLAPLARAARHFGSGPGTMLDVIAQDNFGLDQVHPGAPVGVWAAAVARIEEHAREAGLNPALPAVLGQVFRRTAALGHADEDLAAIIKALRQPTLEDTP